MKLPASIEPLLAGFHVVVSVPVQWGDQDAFAHVNNTVYFRWFEVARIAYIERIGFGDRHRAENVGPILASASCEYRRPVTYPDTVFVGVKTTRIGRSSIGMEQAIVSQKQGVVVAEGKSTLVIIDYQTHTSHAVPPLVRQNIAALEGRSFD
jgi:acyl-CoA thioester hydrolase